MPFLCTGNRKHRGVLVHMCTISCRAYCARAHSMRMFECRTIRMCTSKRAPTALRIFCFGKLKREPKGLIFNTYRLSVSCLVTNLWNDRGRDGEWRWHLRQFQLLDYTYRYRPLVTHTINYLTTNPSHDGVDWLHPNSFHLLWWLFLCRVIHS